MLGHKQTGECLVKELRSIVRLFFFSRATVIGVIYAMVSTQTEWEKLDRN